jgi:ligand-binding sensor domain-containing protein
MHRLTLICALALALTLAPPSAAAQHRFRVHSNPAIAILSIAQGPDGFLWLAAQDGLYRFDGLHYDKMPDFPFASARFVAFTSDGALLVGGREGLARYKDRFEVVSRHEVLGMAAGPDRVYVKLERLVAVLPDKSMVTVARSSRPDLAVDGSGRLWFVCTSPYRACSSAPGQPDEKPEPLPAAEQVVRDSRGQLWAADHERAFALRNGKETQVFERRPSNKTERPGPLITGRQGTLWFLGETIRNLTAGVEFDGRQIYERFQPTAGYEDTRGHFWAAKLGQGLTEWIPDPGWQRWFQEDFGREAAVQVVRTRQGAHVVATRANLYRQDSPDSGWTPLSNQSRRYAALLPLTDGGFFASIRQFGLARLSADGRIVERPPNPLPSDDEYRQILEDGKGRFWVGNKLALLRIEGVPGSLRLAPEALPRDSPTPRGDELDVLAVDLDLDAAGNLWAGYEQGIAWLDREDRWHKLSTDSPVGKVRSLALHDPLAGEDIWVAYRRSGAFSRLRRTAARWILTDFSARSGYNPPDTHFLKRDSRGWIWRGSPEGVYVSDGRHVAPEDWIHLDLQNGLAADTTDQYGFFEDVDGSVWIAGEEGVSHIQPDASWFDAPHKAPPPRITRLAADGRVYLRAESMPNALPANTNLLRIDVGSLDTPEFRDYPFRYRLKPLFDDWKSSRDGSLEFRHLPESSYTLEVAYTGNGISEPLLFPFRVGSAGESISWRWLLGFPLAGGGLTLFVRRAPWFRKANYWVDKTVFLIRCRFNRREAGPAAAAPDHSGEILSGRYRLLQPVSHGGFSLVYDARDQVRSGARVAVKILDAGLGGENWARDRFAYEVAALRSVDHPGVIRILDSWVTSAGEPCLVMPFLEGPTLREEMAAGPLPPRRVAHIVRELGSALSEVHGRGIVHRDLKPENVILWKSAPEGERPVLIDFGMASLRGANDKIWNTTLLGGSLHYMPPERLTGHYSQASDAYSFGVMVLEMLSGKRLADLGVMVTDESFPTAVGRALSDVVEPESLPQLVESLCQCYSAQPQRRPGEVGEWSAAVAELLDRP